MQANELTPEEETALERVKLEKKKLPNKVVGSMVETSPGNYRDLKLSIEHQKWKNRKAEKKRRAELIEEFTKTLNEAQQEPSP